MTAVSFLWALCFLGGADASTPEDRALAYLSRQVPRWFTENKCYSCHNNGDAARALFTARRLGYAVPDGALDDTSRRLSQPHRWDRSKSDERCSDKEQSRRQSAAGLADGLQARD